MFSESTKIKRKINVQDFILFLRKYSQEQIECTPHTFFRLSTAQREMYTCEELKKILISQTPFLVGLQNNQNHAAFYKYQGKNLKIILKINNRKVNIVTFYFVKEWQIPKI